MFDIDDSTMIRNCIHLTGDTFEVVPADELARGLLALLVDRLGRERVQGLLASVVECSEVEGCSGAGGEA